MFVVVVVVVAAATLFVITAFVDYPEMRCDSNITSLMCFLT